MKLAIATDQGNVSAHFGRCPTYTLVEISDGKVTSREEIDNPGHQPGFLPHYLSERNVGVIIAGGMGPRAQGLFAQYNIQTIIGVQGSIDEVLTRFLNHQLEAGEDLCDHLHGQAECTDHPPVIAPEVPLGSNICVTAQGTDLDSEVDPRFGRAPYFLIVNPDTMEFEALANIHKDAGHGAGIQAAQWIATKNVCAVLTGQCGPKAQRVLEAAGIQIIPGITGKVGEALRNRERRSPGGQG
jgi:predicted Fe-Mo cluster-binding NifX family protein